MNQYSNQDFFNTDELHEYVHHDAAADGTVISMTGAHLSWVLEEEDKELKEKEAKEKKELALKNAKAGPDSKKSSSSSSLKKEDKGVSNDLINL